MFNALVLVGLGGAAGSIARFLISYYMAKRFTSGFPWATFSVNVFGALLIGIFIGLFGKIPEQTQMKLLLATGFCGGFTTFSTFSLENISLLQQGHYGMAAVYVLTSLVFGVLAVWLGLHVGS